MNRIFGFLTVVILICLLPACSRAPESAAESIQEAELRKHIETLASDEFEGRAPGTEGEEKTVDYLTGQFESFGLLPGNPDGTYVQKVPLVEITPELTASFRKGGRELGLEAPRDFVAHSMRALPEVSISGSELVFVGYGVVAPEYDWNDFKDVDVTGKTLLMLVNDPQITREGGSGELDESVFKGQAMTYYGRWTYKYEIATEMGAAAALVIHETELAGYPYQVVSRDFGLAQFDIEQEDDNRDRVSFEGWIQREAVAELFRSAGLSFEEMKEAALSRDFEPVFLGVEADMHVNNKIRRIDSKNVAAKLEGSDPDLSSEHLVYVAHWDHLGRDPNLEGDQIFNGALDNASGTAGLLELAEAFSRMSPPPRRSVLFVAVTAEEYGLLGAKYYAANPLYPLEKTVAAVNMDGLNQWGRTTDMVVVGLGNSTLEDVLGRQLEEVGRTLRADPEPEKGFYFRSDHLHFARRGVPALYTDSGVEFIGKAQDFGEKKREEYTARDYHQVSDEVKPDWDLAGAVEDLKVLFRVGLEVADADERPQWKPDSEFKSAGEITR